MAADLGPREYSVLFVDGPFAGQRAVVTSMPPRPLSLYVLPDGAIIAPDRIIANDPAAHALAIGAVQYFAGASPAAGEPRPYLFGHGPLK
jgi:hypothetical protein